MSGKVLIVDGLATNRIILKVKLSAAYFTVLQATDGKTGIDMCLAEQPDAIVIGAELTDQSGQTFLKHLRSLTKLSDVPVMMIQPDYNSLARVTALAAGACDVMSEPVQGDILLARLRTLLRRHHARMDLRSDMGVEPAMGFADGQIQFQAPGHVRVMAEPASQAEDLCARLSPISNYVLTALDQSHSTQDRDPDLILLKFDATDPEIGLRKLATLKADPQTRNCPVLVLLPDAPKDQTLRVLDMGAEDVLPEETDAREIRLRIARQALHKQLKDHLKSQVQNGLKAAILDPLTGLYNRRYALPYMERLMELAANEDAGFAVLVADIDHFKQVNDTYGHAAGDLVLSRIATVLKTSLRPQDMLARIGGEEFMILLPDVTQAEACNRAQQICTRVEQTKYHVSPDTPAISVTTSIGIALSPKSALTHDVSAEDILEHADRALYRSKEKGRNMISVSRAA